jgi:predicted nuclease of restriction endonuclease-like (RecB) superfamily
LLQAALDIEEDMEDLRYNNIVIATDADVDGMHIRLLLITFFLQFFPELIKDGHLYILQTPLFRVRNKKETIYCYSEQERVDAIEKLKPKPEITRFKGLGEISPDEFKHFIGEDIRLDPVMLDKATSIETLLEFYMGKNTPDRQDFIINNLKVELDTTVEIPQSMTREFENRIPQSVTREFNTQKSQSLISFFKLTWTHYTFLMRIDDEKERSFYEIESEKNNWSVRELKRQYDSALYTRLTLSRDKEEILKLSEKGQIIEKPKDLIKDPYILEFLGLPELHNYSESELEQEIINKLEHFLLELGEGFAFVARQKRITFDDKQ